MSKIPLAPVPMYRTANNLDEALSEIQAHTYPYDPNTIRSLVMMYHNTLIKEMLATREIQLPAGRTVNCEPTRYLETLEVAKLLKDNGFPVTINEPED